MTEPRLIVTGDVFRPFNAGGRWVSATWKNVRWLDGIVGTAARLAGWQVSTVSWDEALLPATGYVDTPALYEAVGLPLSRDGWVQLICREDLPPEAEATIRALFDADLVVGIELPDHLLRILNHAGIAVIDVISHPVRFLDDLVLAMRTNRIAIHELLLRHRFDFDLAVLQAGLLRSKAAWMPPPLPLKPGAALVLGQVADDRAAIDTAARRFRQLDNHIDALLDLCTRASMVLYKPHPYDQSTSPAQRTMRRLRSVQWTDANIYHLLAQPEIEVVCAMNSSALTEAEFFGKTTIWLAPPLHTYGEACPAGGFGDNVAQNPAFCSPGFWRAVRDGGEAGPPLLPPRANRLRRSLNADWGFSAVDRVVA